MGLLKQAFENGEFAVTSEMAPPKGIDFAHLRHCAQLIKGRVHAANVTDFQSAVMRATSLATCKVLQEEGIISLPHSWPGGIICRPVWW